MLLSCTARGEPFSARAEVGRARDAAATEGCFTLENARAPGGAHGLQHRGIRLLELHADPVGSQQTGAIGPVHVLRCQLRLRRHVLDQSSRASGLHDVDEKRGGASSYDAVDMQTVCARLAQHGIAGRVGPGHAEQRDSRTLRARELAQPHRLVGTLAAEDLDPGADPGAPSRRGDRVDLEHQVASDLSDHQNRGHVLLLTTAASRRRRPRAVRARTAAGARRCR